MNWIVGKAGLQGDKEADAQEDTKRREGRGWGTNGEGERRERERFPNSVRLPISFCNTCLPLSSKKHICVLGTNSLLWLNLAHADVYCLQQKCSNLCKQLPLD